MKIKEVRDKDDERLLQELTAKRRHLFELRSQAVTEKVEDPGRFGRTRREIARILTVLRERQMQQQTSGEKTPANQ